MQKRRKGKGPALSPDQFALDHPFLRWYAAYHKRKAARCVGADLFLGELAARRFSIGVDDDKMPLFGIAEDDVEAVTALPWTSAAFLRRVKGPVLGDFIAGPAGGADRAAEVRDWIALSCKDARIEGGRSEGPVGIRLWLPTTRGLLDGWIGAPAPQTVRIIEAAIRHGKPERTGKPPLGLIPLSLRGAWEQPPAEKPAAKD